MDRNSFGLSCLNPVSVALRKESVDRNLDGSGRLNALTMSLSARRAWIEMDVTAKTGLFTSVALRKESVDRNTLHAMFFVLFL